MSPPFAASSSSGVLWMLGRHTVPRGLLGSGHVLANRPANVLPARTAGQAAAVSGRAITKATLSPAKPLYPVPLGREFGARALSSAIEEAAPAEIAEETADRHQRRDPPTMTLNKRLDKLLDRIEERLLGTDRVIYRHYRELCQLLKLLREKGQVPTHHQSLMALYCSGSRCVDLPPAERTKRVLEMWTDLDAMGAVLDVAHFNSLLRAHLDNEHEFSATDFLSTMEQRGVKANRVTYQHLVAKYASDGDVEGTSTILEHMKAEDMVVNEQVFHSLVEVHCRVKDFDAARNVMQIMESNGLTVGRTASLAYLLGMTRAGCTTEEVLEELDAVKTKKAIRLHDHDHFVLLLELAKHGKSDAARLVYEQIEKNTGYMQEMRNFLPQLIFLGETDLALDIYSRLPNNMPSGDRREDREKHAVFILNALVARDTNAAADIVKVLERMIEEKLNPDCVDKLLQCCLEQDKVELGRQVLELCKERFGSAPSRSRDTNRQLRQIGLLPMDDEEALIGYLRNMAKLGLAPGERALEAEVMPRLLKPGVSMKDVTQKLYNGINGDGKNIDNIVVQKSQLTTAAVQYMLNQNSAVCFNEVAGYLLHSTWWTRPFAFKISLARTYLSTGDLDSLVSVIFSLEVQRSSNGDNHYNRMFLGEHLGQIHRLSQDKRYMSDQSADSAVKTVLEAMKKHHIGMPPESVAMLKSILDTDSDAELVELLTTLEAYHADAGDYWTPERREEMVKECHGKFLACLRSNGQPQPRKGLRSLEYAWENEKKKESERVDMDLLSKMCSALAREGRDPHKSMSLLMKACEEQESFRPMAYVTYEVALALLDKDPAAAAQFVSFLTERNIPVFASAVKLGLRALMKADGEDRVSDKVHTSVLDFVGNLNRDALLENDIGKGKEGPFRVVQSGLAEYVERAEPDQIQQLHDALFERKFLSPPTSKNHKHLVLMHLREGKKDLDAAYDKFVELATTKRLLPGKYSLMEELIRAEDMERMQRVLDLSIKLMGQEDSLYDLAYNFITVGKIPQARKLMDTPGLRFNRVNAARILDQLEKKDQMDGAWEFSLMLAKLFASDKHYIYTRLVQSNTHRPDKMDELWMLMQEDDYAPTDKLKLRMAAVYEEAGKEAPFVKPAESRK